MHTPDFFASCTPEQHAGRSAPLVHRCFARIQLQLHKKV